MKAVISLAFIHLSVAQLVEQVAVNHCVAGSIPARQVIVKFLILKGL